MAGWSPATLARSRRGPPCGHVTRPVARRELRRAARVGADVGERGATAAKRRTRAVAGFAGFCGVFSPHFYTRDVHPHAHTRAYV